MTLIQILFLALWMVFYGAYLLKKFLLKKQGIQADILGKGQKPSKRVIIETLIKTVTYLGAAVQLFSILFPNFIWSLPAFPIMQEDGLILGALGNICFIAAVVVMGKNWRAGFSKEQHTKLVTNGIYSFSRNPAFLGFDLLYLGCALAFPSALNILLTLAALVLFHLQILGEEEFLIQTFGEDYQQYQKKTMRYFGVRKSHS